MESVRPAFRMMRSRGRILSSLAGVYGHDEMIVMLSSMAWSLLTSQAESQFCRSSPDCHPNAST